MNSFLTCFRRELEILKSKLGEGDKLVIEDFIPDIESITERFSKQGHSGMSASFYAGTLSSTIKKVLSFEPLSPITGDDTEWSATAGDEESGVLQNNRLSSVFKEGKKGAPYYLDAIVWSGEDKHDTFTGDVDNIRSRQNIRLPFTPKTFYVDVVKSEAGIYHIKDESQLNEVFEYYERKDNYDDKSNA